jgi:uncharacterized protein
MLIVLPPSETKAPDGTGAPLDFARLSFTSLTPVREELVAELSALQVEEAMAELGLSERLRGEAEANRELLSAPTMPAVERYTGVLYDALDAATLPDRGQLAVGSALFGVLGADDPIPRYRLSGGSKLGRRTMKSRWGKSVTEALAEVDDLVVDLRSGAYQQLGPLKRAVTVRVESVRDDGTRKVVSHFNKHHKGVLARELADKRADSVEEVASLAEAAGMTVEVISDTELTLVV